VDVIATDEQGNRELFQVTKFHSSSFWHQLRRIGRVDAEVPDIEESVRNAVSRKTNYDPQSKLSINLVIDAQPGFPAGTAEALRMSLGSLLKSSGFREVWLVGTGIHIDQLF
jgi:hypothetical protein